MIIIKSSQSFLYFYVRRRRKSSYIFFVLALAHFLFIKVIISDQRRAHIRNYLRSAEKRKNPTRSN